jgi:hypothetical protein
MKDARASEALALRRSLHMHCPRWALDPCRQPLEGSHTHPQGIPGVERRSAHALSARSLPSQRSLHNAPIFRLLLKVAVNGTHQCDCRNFCGGLGSQQEHPSNDPLESLSPSAEPSWPPPLRARAKALVLAHLPFSFFVFFVLVLLCCLFFSFRVFCSCVVVLFVFFFCRSAPIRANCSTLQEQPAAWPFLFFRVFVVVVVLFFRVFVLVSL